MTFGEKLQKLRQREGMSQDALAELLDVSRQAVSRWERDETMPETEKVLRISQCFHVTTDYLLKDDAPEQPDGGKKRTVADRMERLASTKGYLLGWLLVVWGGLDLVRILWSFLLVHGMLGLGADMNLLDILALLTDKGPGTISATLAVGAFGLPLLYAALKITAGILVVRFGKRYAEKFREGQSDA